MLTPTYFCNALFNANSYTHIDIGYFEYSDEPSEYDRSSYLTLCIGHGRIRAHNEHLRFDDIVYSDHDKDKLLAQIQAQSKLKIFLKYSGVSTRIAGCLFKLDKQGQVTAKEVLTGDNMMTMIGLSGFTLLPFIPLCYLCNKVTRCTAVRVKQIVTGLNEPSILSRREILRGWLNGQFD